MRIVLDSSRAPRQGALGMITQWLVNAVGLTLLARTVGGVVLAAATPREALLTVLGASAVLGLLEFSVRPLLLLVTLPVNILSLGLFTLVINGAVLWGVGAVVPTFHVAGFGVAVWAALCLSVFTLCINLLLGGLSRGRVGR